jgi:hypothetical protein
VRNVIPPPLFVRTLRGVNLPNKSLRRRRNNSLLGRGWPKEVRGRRMGRSDASTGGCGELKAVDAGYWG